MTDAPTPNRPPRPRLPLSTGDIATLAVCLLASTAAVVIGIALFWDVLNPSKWTADGWAAGGSWFAGAATVGAVIVALRQISAARSDAKVALAEAERLHQRQLNEEILKADLGATTALLPALSDFASAMQLVDYHFELFTWDTNQEDPGGPRTRSREDTEQLWRTNSDHREVIKAHLVALQAASLAVRVPALRAALDEVVRLTMLTGEQAHTWGMQTMRGLAPLSPVLDHIEALDLPLDYEFGPLSALARRSESGIHDALKGIHETDPWADQDDASIAP